MILTTSSSSSLPVSVNPPNTLQVGTTATVQCRVKELDQTFRVEWQKPDGSVKSSNTVHLNPVDASHGGDWQCRVVNTEDQFSKTLSITVMGMELLSGETSCSSLCYNKIDPRSQNECFLVFQLLNQVHHPQTIPNNQTL